MGKYEELLAEKEKLYGKLSEIETELQALERSIIRGKMEKAIGLLQECAISLGDALVIDTYASCEGCACEANVELYLSDIAVELERYVRYNM